MQIGASLVNADVFVDGSGASALVRVNGHLFACSFAASRSVVRLVQNRAQSNRCSKRVQRAAEALFASEVVDHLTPAYLAKHAELYSRPEES